MTSQRDNGGPIGIAVMVAVAAVVLAALVLRVLSSGPVFVRRPDGGVVAEPDAGAPSPLQAAAGQLALPAIPAADAGTTRTADAGVAAPPVAVGPGHPLNVILITVDTLRADLGFMGYPKPITTNIDQLAARSTVFERTYSTASFTPKSLGPLHIGRYASETNRDFEHYTTFFPSNVFLAERAHDLGVRTFAGMCHRYFTFRSGFAQGFDVFDTSAVPPGMTDSDTRSTSPQLTEVAINLLGKPENTGSGKPFFAWFHYFDPHLPYVRHEGSPDFGRSDRTQAGSTRAQYDEEVWFTDAYIGRLLDFIKSQPWAEHTAIVLTADHGEAFGEKKHWGHGRELWEPLVRVPLVVYVPGLPAHRIPLRRSHIDLAPTIVELLGGTVKADGSLRGQSLLPDLTARIGQPLVEHDVFIDMPEGPFNEMRRAFISGPSPGMKLIEMTGKRYELYDLGKDPQESENLATVKETREPFVEKMNKLRAGLDSHGPP
ncbi:MAG: hypothetical protein JWP97_1903 [Labilithrix sp.]|nr:hypothetical protein [Labilithrix sp.]